MQYHRCWKIVRTSLQQAMNGTVNHHTPCLPQDGADEVQDGARLGGRVVKRFIPFSEGSRDCVGQSLARLNLTTTLAQLFGSFSFRLDELVRARLNAPCPSRACCLPAVGCGGIFFSLGVIVLYLHGIVN